MRAMLAIAGVLLSTNLTFLGWSVLEGLRLAAPLSAPPAPVTVADLSMTLAGMPEHSGDASCAELARFVAALNAALMEAGETALPIHAPLSDPLMQTSCRIDDEAVADRLRPYRRRFRSRSLPPPPAFAHFASATERR
ncbi:MAG: hypothetical protein P8R54_17200 [Myxococcota bacterium]|nr:hypothetical protein [Myxococcota bacterium]